MADIKKKKIREKAQKFYDVLHEGAAGVKFRGRTDSDLNTKLTTIGTKESLRSDLQAQIDLLDDDLENEYVELDDMLVDYRKGVEGHESYGDDSPLYGAMGFVRKSERKSGLTKKKKTGGT